ncbi:hypothetical protein D3C78_1406140 [compost metagenome]
MAASLACGVPGTETSTLAFGSFGEILAKSAGRSLPSTNCHGPLSPGPLNQRPETSTYQLLLVGSTNTAWSVLDMLSRAVPSTGDICGGPSLTISSVGSLAMTMLGGCAAFLPSFGSSGSGMALLAASFAALSSGCGGLFSTSQLPSRPWARYQ